MKRVLDTNTLKSKKTVVDNPCSPKLLFLTLLLFFLAAPVSAATPDVCKQYADSAMNQLQQAKDLGISGLNPPTWSDNYALHLGWCLTAPDTDVKNGTAVRQAIIDEYKNVPPATSTAPFIPKSPQMQPVQADIVVPGVGIGQTAPNSKAAANTKALPRFAEHCYDGPGSCLWVIPHARRYHQITLTPRYYDQLSLGKSVRLDEEKTMVDIQFSSNKERLSYVCAFMTAGINNIPNPPDHISIKSTFITSYGNKYDKNLRPDASEGLMLDTVSSFGECSVTELPESVYKILGHIDWNGSIIIVSREPMFVSARSVSSHYGNAKGYAKEITKSEFGTKEPPATLDHSFLGGDTERVITPYAIDCRKPSGYEGVCAYAKHLLEKIN